MAILLTKRSIRDEIGRSLRWTGSKQAAPPKLRGGDGRTTVSFVGPSISMLGWPPWPHRAARDRRAPSGIETRVILGGSRVTDIPWAHRRSWALRIVQRVGSRVQRGLGGAEPRAGKYCVEPRMVVREPLGQGAIAKGGMPGAELVPRGEAMPGFEPVVEAFYHATIHTLSDVVYDPVSRDAVSRDAVIIDPVLDDDAHAHADHLSASQWLGRERSGPVAIDERIGIAVAGSRAVDSGGDRRADEGGAADLRGAARSPPARGPGAPAIFACRSACSARPATGESRVRRTTRPHCDTLAHRREPATRSLQRR